MKRLWTKNVDSITTNFINYPYVYAFLAVMLGFLAGVCFPRHDNSLVDNFLRFCLIFLAAGNCGTATQSLNATISWECILIKSESRT
jgi:hypothetical protein